MTFVFCSFAVSSLATRVFPLVPSSFAIPTRQSSQNFGLSLHSLQVGLPHFLHLLDVTVIILLATINAIKSINSDAVRFSEDKIFDNDGNEISINETDITNKIAELKTAYDNLEYQRKRAAEYAFGAIKGKKAVYINFVVRIASDCDCLADSEIIGKDVGIIAGTDPLAVDKASYDLVYEKHGKDICPNWV